MTVARLIRILARRQRLACHWRFPQKEMTNHTRCDKKLELGTHAFLKIAMAR
jgi:hypothetical protein